PKAAASQASIPITIAARRKLTHDLYRKSGQQKTVRSGTRGGAAQDEQLAAPLDGELAIDLARRAAGVFLAVRRLRFVAVDDDRSEVDGSWRVRDRGELVDDLLRDAARIASERARSRCHD